MIKIAMLCLKAVLWIRMGFKCGSGSTFYLNAGPDPYPGSQTSEIQILFRLLSHKVDFTLSCIYRS
jgi:hypothetical protein